uniref:MINDY lysine 48 deubiquitinase 3 n=1 Tax=Rousettus aegyptiacus TaxID=9407 RepID=A0A7J8E971_ROUAE|nr:MINDY lysine 48 deubiquitinase 3 [Rousettus aegyptiacus]
MSPKKNDLRSVRFTCSRSAALARRKAKVLTALRFPQGSSGPESFTVYHYNGLKQSNHSEKVMYVEGTAVIMGFEDPMLQTDDTPIKRCLQTKWPYIELLWTTDRSPSLN